MAVSPWGNGCSVSSSDLPVSSPLATSEARLAIHRAVDLAEDAVEFIVLIEDVGDERIGLHGEVRLGLESDFHGFLSLSSLLSAAER